MNAITSFPGTGQARRYRPPVVEADFFWPLAIIGGLLLLVCIAGTHVAVRAFNSSSAVREQILVENGIHHRIEEVAQMVAPQILWDDAVQHLDNKYDAQWAADNIGKYLNQTERFEQSFIIDAADLPVFAATGGVTVPVADEHILGGDADHLVADVRARERARGPIKPGKPNAMVARSIQANALKAVDGRLSIVTVSLVQPDFGKAMPRGPRSPIVITVMPVDATFLESFAERFMLDRLHAIGPADEVPSGEVAIPVRDELKRIVGYFAWRPLDPGYVMLRAFLGPVAIVGVLFAGIAFFQLRRIHVAARRLLDGEDFMGFDAHHFPDDFDMPEAPALANWPPPKTAS
jgi:hypothetical protein